MQFQDGLELSLVHVLLACVQVSNETCTVPLENILYLQSNWNNVTEYLGSLVTDVLPLCGCWTFLKANDSPGLQTCFVDLWTCVQCAGGSLHEVFLCTCTGSTCIAVIAGVEGVVVLKEVAISGTVGTVLVTVLELTTLCTVLELYWYCSIAGAKGVVVLKEVSISGAVGTVLELYWHCTALCLFHMSFNIWKMLDIPFAVLLSMPFPVLAQEIPFCVLCDVPFPVLPLFILLKLGTLSPFTTFSSW